MRSNDSVNRSGRQAGHPHPLPPSPCYGEGEPRTAGIKDILFIFLLMGLLTGCNLTMARQVPTGIPTPIPVTGNFTDVPTYAPIMTVTRAGLSATDNATGAAFATPRCAPADTLPVKYSLNADVDYDARNVHATLDTIFRNETGQPLQELVFNIDPNRKTGQFTLLDVVADNMDKYVLTGPRLDILLNTPLDLHCQAHVSMTFIDQLNAIPNANSPRGYFGFSDRQLNLGNWLPEIAPFVDGGWNTPKASVVGEYTASVLSDFDAQVRVKGGDQTKMDVVGPGEESYSAGTWTFKAPSMRSFTLCISSQLSKLTATSDGGVTVDLYYFKNGQPAKAPDGSAIDGPGHALETAKNAVNLYTKLYGPVPYKRIVVVQGDFTDGMEFSGLVFVSNDWFARYEGQPDSWLTLITAHEVAHQWFYAMVSDDQAQYPYLDETFAIYNESLYLQTYYPTLVSWWWKFRVTQYVPTGYVDSTVYEYQSVRLYINAVYLRGALMLDEIRKIIGDPAFSKWLRDYVIAEAGKIATPVDLWKAMSPADYVLTEGIRAIYMRNPDPIHPWQPTAEPGPGTPTQAAQPAKKS